MLITILLIFKEIWENNLKQSIESNIAGISIIIEMLNQCQVFEAIYSP